MAVTSRRTIGISFQGAVDAPGLSYAAAENSSSPGDIDLQNLASGVNTITKAIGAKAATIIPPTGNTVLITLKGVTGDTGVVIHPTDPTSIGLDATVTSFVLTAASAVTGIRIIWT